MCFAYLASYFDAMRTKISEFFRSSTSSGIILTLCVVLSLAIANSPLGDTFQRILDTSVGFATDLVQLRYSVGLWINDGLMAIFFLMVGLEIKREIVAGELSTARQAALPVLCAVGGAVVPASIYVTINAGELTSTGWGIPMATDIAFALAVVTFLGKRVPPALKIFLAALAIVDDLIAVMVIALFYSSDLHLMYLLYGVVVWMLLIALNRMGVQSLWFYLIPGLFMWYFIHHSGIHATIAGVLTATAIPAAGANKKSPLERLEHSLSIPVSFIIVPVFALANTNITFDGSMVAGLFAPLGLGIIFGLVLGKPIGITLVAWIASRLNIATLPTGFRWRHVVGLGLLAGIGFTMSIFIALLSFKDPFLIAEAKLAVLVGSFISMVSGCALLWRNGNQRRGEAA